jgi:hypothetical protein
MDTWQAGLAAASLLLAIGWGVAAAAEPPGWCSRSRSMRCAGPCRGVTLIREGNPINEPTGHAGDDY